MPSNELIKTKFFYIFEHVLSDLSNVMDIMSFAFGKLYFAKQTTHRSSRSHMFSKIRALKNVTNSTGKRLRWSRFLITLEALHDSEHLGGCFLTQLLLYRKTHFSETLRDSTWNWAVFFRLIKWFIFNIYIYIYIYILYIYILYIIYVYIYIYYI